MSGDGVELQVLGCGDAMGSGGCLQSCFSMRRGERRVLVDFGVTGMIALRRYGIDPNEVETVLLTHLHGDHFGGLPFFLLDAKYVSRRHRPLHLAGPATTAERLQTLRETLYPGSSAGSLGFDLDVVELVAGSRTEIDDLVVTPFEVIHESGAPAHGLRLEWGGRCVAFSGDTQWTDALVELARGADLFVCEASSYEHPVPFHLDYETLLANRSRLECGRLLLTHLGAEMLSRRQELEIESAEDGLVLQL